MQQTLEQTITINYGNTTDLAVPNTGTLSDINILPIILLITIILLAASFYLIKIRKSSGKSFQGFGVFIFLALATIALTLNLPTASAIPSLTLAANQQNINITIPEGGGTASATTTVTTNTVNETGYKLTASLAQAEPGIDISLRGGDISTNTSLIANATPLSLKTTTEANLNDTADTTEVTLTFTIDGTVTPGQKQLKLIYTATDNFATIQSFTVDECDALPIYDGTNEDAIITLHDPRGNGANYQVAKLADGNCWMLDNLKLGSTTNSINLTSADTDIADDFTLPQVTAATGAGSFDDPGVYGPVPGDTGTGATNYGYLYNWSAATAGETTETMPADSGNAQYSICPAGWRLPFGGAYESGDGEFADLDRAFGGTGYVSFDGQPNIAKWQENGPFKGTMAGIWFADFSSQNIVGLMWSNSTDGSEAAFGAGFTAGASVEGEDTPANVAPAGPFGGGEAVSENGGAPRNMGLSVRCLKQRLVY